MGYIVHPKLMPISVTGGCTAAVIDNISRAYSSITCFFLLKGLDILLLKFNPPGGL